MFSRLLCHARVSVPNGHVQRPSVRFPTVFCGPYIPSCQTLQPAESLIVWNGEEHRPLGNPVFLDILGHIDITFEMMLKAITVAGLAATGSAHIMISNPVPFGKSSLTNSPLANDGSDFPCKQRSGVYDADGASNVYKQGSTQQLEFRGSAVHGGGSCQVSMTTDLKPTKNSVWKVIKSIEGGCPAKNQGGNMGGGAGADTPYKYDYTIPTELAAGNYTLAWTWFNKIGNREMYMNCAPVSVTGSGGSQGYLESLPDMFVANVGKGCGTESGKDVQFPNPGKDVDRFNGATSAFAPPTGSCPTGNSGGGGNQGGGSYQPPPTAKPSPPAEKPSPPAEKPSYKPEPSSEAAPSSSYETSVGAPSYAAPQPTAATTSAAYEASVPGAVFATVSDSPSAPSQAAAPTPEAPAAPGNGTAPSEGHAAGTACSPEGTWNCLGKSFQRCASGQWSVVQNMAAGTACTPGESAELKMSAANVRRSMRGGFRYYAA
ncbi:hypothetical protein XA68_15032 [Ophiocordyceps unilateralis]|uniref:Chitin-binding type-4 domain-containing protein n=1 Tax=Ophiocordyceps unilateralis TaxID=268505 RepID=A0A2A9P817_OPHUN|nr:hypothetical protein XA68_15032 [Ophiocordyceps unilateralis]